VLSCSEKLETCRNYPRQGKSGKIKNKTCHKNPSPIDHTSNSESMYHPRFKAYVLSDTELFMSSCCMTELLDPGIIYFIYLSCLLHVYRWDKSN
jgi:hypothetical protein